MSTSYQSIYDSAFCPCVRKDRMRMLPLLELFVPRTKRRGSTSQPKCLSVEEREKKRKAVSEEACSRNAHSYIKDLYLHTS